MEWLNTIPFEHVCFPTLQCFDAFLSGALLFLPSLCVRVKKCLVLLFFDACTYVCTPSIRTGTVDYPMLGTGMTPLMTAAASGWKDGCFELIRNDASLTVSSVHATLCCV